jgi:uncharacterized protein
MTSIMAFIKRHPVRTYYALAFALSWGAVLTVIGPGGILATQEQYERLMPLVGPVMLIGPTIAGILLTVLVYGRVGLRELLSRLLRWRVGARWYAVALLTAPLLVAAVLLVLSLLSPAFLPGIFTADDKAIPLLMAMAVGLFVGTFEELGWTGFAIPQLRQRFGVLTTGLIAGFLWATWHVLVNVWASASMAGDLSLTIFLPALLVSNSIGYLPAFRVLMVWVYDRTESLFVAMLMHASLTAVFFLQPPLAGVAVLAYILLFAAVLWLVVAAVTVANRRQLSRQPLRRQVA